MQHELLKVEKLCKKYNAQNKESVIFEYLDLSIYAGDFTVIMGPSGAGKSTLLHALSGMDTISDGKVLVQNEKKELHRMTEKEMAQMRAKRFGFVFQQTHLVSNLSVEENMLVAGYNGKKRKPVQIKEKAEKLLQKLEIENIRHQLAGHISGGEAQRAAIARALINEPDIIFADEPTGALNRKNSQNILDILTKLNQDGQSILMVTHDIKAAIRGTRILYLLDGVIAGEQVLAPYEAADEQKREDLISEWLRSLEW